MRFAVIDPDDKVLRSWDTGDEMRIRMGKVFSRQFRFIKLRPTKRRELEKALDTALAEMFHEFGLDVSRRHTRQ